MTAAASTHAAGLQDQLIGFGDGEYGTTSSLPDVSHGTAAVSAGASYSVVLRTDGTLVAWGSNAYGQGNVPVGLTGVAAVSAGPLHVVALKTDGTVVAWGNNNFGQTTVPAGLAGVRSVAAGGSHTVALTADGTVVAWGRNVDGQTSVPPGLTSVVAVAAGAAHTVALRSDGTVAAWGRDLEGQTNVPPGLTGVVAIAAGTLHTVALKSDGTVVAWGSNTYGQTTVPSGLGSVVALSAGDRHTVALRNDGTVVTWGSNTYGQLAVPSGLTGVTAISAGYDHTLALKSDGTIVAWGDDSVKESTISGGVGPVTAIAAGSSHLVALQADGTVAAWGQNVYGEANVPPGLSDIVAVAAGEEHTVALRRDGAVFAWGCTLSSCPYNKGQSLVPAGLGGVVAVAAGQRHTLAVKTDGTVVAWGANNAGQATVPPGLTGVTAVAAGYFHSVALRNDGTVVAWGATGSPQSTVPAGLAGVVAIAAAGNQTVALKWDGTVVAWGSNTYGESTVPAGLGGVTAIAASGGHTVALKNDGTIVAWGTNFLGETTIPPELTGVTAIAAGAELTVAVRASYPLTTAVSGSGSITSSPFGIECGTYCSKTFGNGTMATLTARPSPGWLFTGWSGACSGSGPCTVAMDSPKSVSAAFLQAPGSACSVDTECATGSCVDRVCCDRPCGGQCEACDVPGLVGTCTAVVGAPHNGRPGCATDGTACGGGCDGSATAACTYPGAATQCRAPSCAGDVGTFAAVCNGSGACGSAVAQACAPYVCGPSACRTNCTSDVDCSAGLVCAGAVCKAPVLIASIAPDSGPAVGGTTVSVEGSEFAGGASVMVGGAPAGAVTVATSSALTFVTPPGVPGWADVVVTLPDGRHAVAAGAFRYVPAPAITSVTPASGPLAGGTTITVVGTGFTAGATVAIRGAQAVSSVLDSATVVAITPPGAAGPADVQVTNPDGQTGVAPGGFTYLDQTPTGTTVAVAPVVTNPVGGSASPISLTFDAVTQGGTTTVTESSTPSISSATPPQFRVGNPPVYYDIASTATFTGTIRVCVSYAGVSYGNPSNLKLFHYQNAAWTDVTTSVDVTQQLVCGSVTSLSPFVLLERFQYTVAASVAGPGSIAGDGIACSSSGGACTASVDLGTSVTLTASPAPGYTTVEWTGCAPGPGLTSCTVPGDSDASVTATFGDVTAPVVSVPPGLVATSTTAAGAYVAFTPTATDTADGALTPTCSKSSGSLFPPGNTRVTCTATDRAGNVGSASFTVQVTFAWSNYLQPINLDGSSIFKLGRTIPTKLQLTGPSAGITNLTAHISVAPYRSSIIGTIVEAASTAAADSGNTYRYDPTSGQYVFNLSTSPLSQGSWVIRTDLGDGVPHDVVVSLTP